ncbi:hypothetical protein [Tepidibacter aestuarii]|uniref:hypothetical protein n=1 Tax=Tepidibacter aestuarii TaxID=2925782 RepID=UPI0020C0BDDF|nr:hypothetical protein [Tepidibacter aestuarii]CAH2211852.1 conserved protein of unknown function [Tepidibacter aestuarii]
MFSKVYEKKEFIIFPIKKGYVVYNLKKDFSNGHTHLRNFNSAKMAIDLVVNKKIPKSTNFYYLTSLIRISQDEDYINKIEELIETRKSKGKKKSYYNNSYCCR